MRFILSLSTLPFMVKESTKPNKLIDDNLANQRLLENN